MLRVERLELPRGDEWDKEKGYKRADLALP